MDINIKTWAVVALLGAAQGFILSLFLFFFNKTTGKANKILAVLIILFSLRLAEFTGYWTTFFLNYPHFSFLTSSFPFLYGVLLYLYVKQKTNGKKVFKKIDLLHFLPFLIHVIFLLPYYFQGSEYKLAALMNSIYTNDPILPVRFFTIRSVQDVLMLVYTGISLKLLYGSAINTNIKKSIGYTWIRNLIVGFAIFVFLDVLNLIELIIFKYRFVVEIESILMISSTALIYALGYFAMKKPLILSEKDLGKGSRYEKSGLTEHRAKDYLTRLIKSMEDDKLFRENNLNLTALSKRLNIPQHHLSQILNEKLNQNFFDFVNKYRVEEAKRLLNCPDYIHYTILAIALESGFNNKVSFNYSFKKLTGSTPSQYRSTNRPQYV
ncbi:MAG: helix-turn-helix domain-containing protein [Ignavibacteria bacterium]|jgi:AraC-like DNA-binding protein